jgi:hypothetical protein
MTMRGKPVQVDPAWLDGIRAWLDRGNPADGRWYADARRWCKQTAREVRTDYRRVAAVLATMSPGTNWDRNKSETRALLAGTETEFTTYPANVLKAEHIREVDKRSDYLDLVKPRPGSGWKIGSFYRNIVDPDDAEPVTIDRHAIAVCLGHAPDDREQQLTAYRYRCYAEAYRLVAAERGLTPNAVQAITWCEYRRANGDLHQGRISWPS